MTTQNAFIIGLFQLPGDGTWGLTLDGYDLRGGMQQGLTRRQAAEFSFFLAVPTMFGATLLKGYKLIQGAG